jgi:glycosyltransferase involved in cell wall biosynthesis
LPRRLLNTLRSTACIWIRKNLPQGHQAESHASEASIAGAAKGQRRYRYHVSRTLVRGNSEGTEQGWRISAPEIEQRVSAHERSERIGKLDLRVIGNPWYVRGQRGNPLALSMLTHLRGVDVVHCHQQHLLATSLAALACRATRRRVFVTDLGGGGWDVSAYVSTDRWFDGHLHLSEYSRTIFGHAGKAFAHVILGGVDTQRFSPGLANAGDGAVVYAGRLLPHKGINDLITAMAPEMELKIIGRVADERFLADLHRMAAGKRVTFRHDCDDAELIQAYRGAMCIVLPSVYRTIYGDETRVPELLGQTLLEGMACARPVICTRVASMPEIVEDGICGFIVPPNDPAALADRIGWLREHPAEAAAMGVAARQRVLDKFTWPQVVGRCLEIYAGTRAA